MFGKQKIISCHKEDKLFGCYANLGEELNYVKETGSCDYFYGALTGEEKPKLMHVEICNVLSETVKNIGLSGLDLKSFVEVTFNGKFENLIEELNDQFNVEPNL